MYEKSRERKRNKEKMRQIDNEGKENSIPNTHVEEKWVEIKNVYEKAFKNHARGDKSGSANATKKNKRSTLTLESSRPALSLYIIWKRERECVRKS